jgi:hypothetical protein
MRRNQQSINLFVILCLSTLFIFGFSHFGAQAFGIMDKTNDGYLPGTSIVAINIVGKNEDEVSTLLKEKHSEWLKNTELQLQFKEKDVTIDINSFNFQLQESILNINDGQPNDVTFTFGKDKVKEMVRLISLDLDETKIDMDKLSNQMVRTLSTLDDGKIIINLNDYVIGNQSEGETIIGEAVIKSTDVPAFEVDDEGFSKIDIPALSTFSLLEYLKEQDLTRVSQSTLNIMASGIYRSVLPTNFSIIERYIGDDLPGYAEHGYESKIDIERNLDLVLLNPNAHAYTLDLDWDTQGVRVTLRGESLLFDYKINVRDEQHFKPKTIKQYSTDFSSGQKKIQQVGSDGSLIKVYRDVYENDKLIESVLLSEDFYPPIPRIEIYALQEPVIQPEDSGIINEIDEPDGNSIEQPAIPNGTQDDGIPDTNPNRDGNSGNESTVDPQVPNPGENDLWGKPNEEPK